MKRYLVLMAAAGAGLGLGGCKTNITDKDLEKRTVGAADVYRLTTAATAGNAGGALLMLADARSPKAYAAGHIPGARTLQLKDVPSDGGRDPEIEKYKNLIIYGEDPASPPAKALTKRMLEVGYKDARFYAGGIKDWQKNGYPLETASAPAPAK